MNKIKKLFEDIFITIKTILIGLLKVIIMATFYTFVVFIKIFPYLIIFFIIYYFFIKQ